ncbi:hypothetical protein TNCV_1762841 [Trichonephila clavipes]|nr:hypothetical protein TNCV_1762841 [Trichonephila clavipes]
MVSSREILNVQELRMFVQPQFLTLVHYRLDYRRSKLIILKMYYTVQQASKNVLDEQPMLLGLNLHNSMPPIVSAIGKYVSHHSA